MQSDDSQSNPPASSSDESSLGYPGRSNFPDLLSEPEQEELVASLLLQGYQGPQILHILQDEYNISMSSRTLTRRREQWGLQKCDLPQTPQLPPPIHAWILSSHQQGLTVKEMCTRLSKDIGKDVSQRTVERYLAKLNLKQRRNDLADDQVTRGEVTEAIHHARQFLLATSAGYRRMNQILKNSYQIHVPRYDYFY